MVPPPSLWPQELAGELREVFKPLALRAGLRCVQGADLLRGGRLLATLPQGNGALRSAILGLELRPVAGPRLQLSWDGGSKEV